MLPKRTHTISRIGLNKNDNRKRTSSSFPILFSTQRYLLKIFFSFCSAVSIFLLLIQLNGPYVIINLVTWDKFAIFGF